MTICENYRLKESGACEGYGGVRNCTDYSPDDREKYIIELPGDGESNVLEDLSAGIRPNNGPVQVVDIVFVLSDLA